MEPEASLPCLQLPATFPHPELKKSSPHLPVLGYFFKNDFTTC